MRNVTASVWLVLLTLLGSVAAAEDPFAAGVRPTDPLSPEDEQKTFQVPEGFEMQLFAAEPDIFKPLNMAFDERGRLWITDTLEYPYAAPLDKPGRDSIKVLEDTDGDGRADKVTTFADGLNIPMGLYPYDDGVIAFSIPNIWRLRDTDGDGRCDKREKLYGPMGWQRDTHGLNNAFRRGFDGWLYACHGFNNETTVQGADGNVVQMNSGNTYRMRLDGSRVEHFTHGQVNPFGMTIDPLFNLFTADCHSKPIYQLIRGGYYPSFGKPDGGLGFVPPMMDHLHGSTAICGLVQYTGNGFPEAYRGHMFSGNVMTSRVNHNALEYNGSTIRAIEQPDLLETTDPWFRPVDIQQGPDGALYIADFYNRIIGHYEVPLEHPQRDRHRGRIWRLVYRGKDAEAAKKPFDLTKASTAELVEALGDENLTVSILALNRLVDVVGKEAVGPLMRMFELSDSAHQKSHILWALVRLGEPVDAQLEAAVKADDRQLRVHAMRVLSEVPEWKDQHTAWVLGGLKDSDAFVRRSAADALAQHPTGERIRPLLDALAATPGEDNHLNYMIRHALRAELAATEKLASLDAKQFSPGEAHTLASIALAIQSSSAANYLVQFLEQHLVEEWELRRMMEHAARYADAELVARLGQVTRERFANEPERQVALLASVQAGLAQRGVNAEAALADWSSAVAAQLLDGVSDAGLSWAPIPLEGKAPSDDPWQVETRVSADGNTDSLFFGSLPRGEQRTGMLRSEAFELPSELSFWIAGHIGHPGQPIDARNFVRLRDAATHELLQEIQPLRHDDARRVVWDLSAQQGRHAYLELIDGDERDAYAWLAVGRFSVPALNPSNASRRLTSACELVERFKLTPLEGRLVELLRQSDQPAMVGPAARALASLRGDSRLAALALLVGDVTQPEELREHARRGLLADEDPQIAEALSETMLRAPQNVQAQLAERLAGDAAGSRALLELVRQGRASPRLLQQPNLRERMLASRLENAEAMIAELTTQLPSEDAARDDLIRQRSESFAQNQGSVERGLAVFTKNCAACHQVAGQGAVVGPQLDGIGNRGLARVAEDILDPNRNVDIAFQTTTLLLENGQVVSGLLRRQEGATIVLADQKGQEISVQVTDVDEQAKSRLSLMPTNFAEVLPESELNDLLAYLLSQRGTPPAAE